MANQRRQNVLERIDAMNCQIEVPVKETRLARESSEQIGKIVLDRLKLEGEIANKAFSIGFADLARKPEQKKDGLP
jgi:transcriptional regulator NrdR family protein